MSRSARYKDLISDLRKLRNALLPIKFDATGTYRCPEGVHLRTISYRILVHAEIESFIEDRAYTLFDEAWNNWINDKIPSRVLSALLAFSGQQMPIPTKKLSSPGKNNHEKVDDIILRAKKHWKDVVYKDNHGIKEANVLGLLLPLGIDGGDIDTTLLADLTSFGGLRGAVAHKSSIRIKSYADPKSEYDKANQLVVGLESIDKLIVCQLDELKKIKKALKKKR